MKYINTFEMKKQTPKFSVGDNIIYLFSNLEDDVPRLTIGKTYEIERCTWSKRKHTFVYKLKGVGSDNQYYTEKNFISELEYDIKNYNL